MVGILVEVRLVSKISFVYSFLTFERFCKVGLSSKCPQLLEVKMLQQFPFQVQHLTDNVLFICNYIIMFINPIYALIPITSTISALWLTQTINIPPSFCFLLTLLSGSLTYLKRLTTRQILSGVQRGRGDVKVSKNLLNANWADRQCQYSDPHSISISSVSTIIRLNEPTKTKSTH